MSWRLTFGVLAAGYGAHGADVVAVSRSGNSFEFRLDDGYAEILWMNPSTVRVRQAWRDQAPYRPSPRVQHIAISMLDGEHSVRLRSRDLVVVVSKQPFALRFESADGDVIAEHAATRLLSARQLEYHFLLQPEERLYGLGYESPDLNRRGTTVDTSRPLLISSEGYGLYFPGSRNFRFDLGASQASGMQILASGAARGDYVFYYGGAPAQILEQHFEWFGEPIETSRALTKLLPPIEKPAFAPLLEGTWAEILRQTFQAGFSGIPVTAIDVSLVRGIRTRYGADLLAAVMPVILAPEGARLSPEAEALRGSFESHRLTYLMEARERGLPCIHSMAYQFPFDAEASAIGDQFFFGDELLVAPLLGSANRRQVYLPQGIWTDWKTNQVYRGRQTMAIQVDETALPMYARNGSIVPVNRADHIELHYFPKLGGEYFLWEPEIDQITQVHAGPAGDFLRLQIEERQGRAYEWVVHNVARPTGVASGARALREGDPGRTLAAFQWRYDATQKNLHIRLETRKDDDLIVSVAFRSAVWALQ